MTSKLSKKILPIILVLGLLVSCSGPSKVVAPVKPTVKEVNETDKLASTFYLIEGVRQKNLGNWPQATIEYLTAIEKDPGNDAAYYELAKAHLMQGEYSDAVTFARQASNLDPQNIEYSLLLADLFILSENINGAIEIFGKLTNQYPERHDLMIRLANSYIYANRPAEALNVFNKLEQKMGSSEMVTVQKLRLLMQMGRTKEAIDEAEKMVLLFPAETLFIEALSDLYLETGQEGKALSLLREFFEKDPQNPDALFMLADYYQQTREWEKALELLKEVFDNPAVDNNEKERVLYVLYYVVEDEPDLLPSALEFAKTFVDQNPQYAQGYNIYADLQRQAENYQEARDAYKMSAELDPANLVVWQQLLFLDNRLEDYQSMLEHSTTATELFFEQPLLFLLKAQANIMLKDYDGALDALTFGFFMLQDDPDLRVEFLIMLGDVNHYLGNHRESDQSYEMALQIDPENAGALNNYAYMLSLRKERLYEARNMAIKATTLRPDTSAFEDTMGWIYFQMGQYSQAKEWIEKAIQNSESPSPTVYEHFGDALYKLGQKDQALEYWKKALEAGEESDVLSRKIEEKTYYEE